MSVNHLDISQVGQAILQCLSNDLDWMGSRCLAHGQHSADQRYNWRWADMTDLTEFNLLVGSIFVLSQ
jgi:hypothetical protein